MKNEVKHTAHSSYRCEYHVVFAPKYRRKIIYKELRKDIIEIFKKLCNEMKIEIIEGEACPDHIHLLVTCLLYTSDGNFEITGTGSMPSFHSSYDYDWHDYRLQISTVTIQEGITSIGWLAFGGCENLTTVTLPTTLEDVGMDIFSGCSALENITVAEGNPRYISKNGCLINTQTKTLVAGTKNASIPIDEAIETIGGYAFIWVDFSFEDLVLPNTCLLYTSRCV